MSAVPVFEHIVAQSCLPELREAFKGHPRIAAALVDPKPRHYGASKVAVLPITDNDAEMIANHLVAIGGSTFSNAGRGLLRRIGYQNSLQVATIDAEDPALIPTIAPRPRKGREPKVLRQEGAAISPAPKPKRRRKADAAIVESAQSAQTDPDYRAGYREALEAFSENLGDPGTTQDLRDARDLYRALASRPGATPYVLGMAAGFIERMG